MGHDGRVRERRLTRAWWRLVGLTLLAVGAGFLLLAATARDDDQFNRYVGWANILGFALAVPGVALVAFDRAKQPAEPAVSTAEHLRTAADVLARLVREQWTEEAKLRALGEPEPMPVRWRLTDREVMDHPRLIATGVLSFAGRSDQMAALAERFRSLRRRRLVVLGGAGSGKTTLAVQLVLELLRPNTRGADEPVPVLLSVAGWDTEIYPRLQDWLAVRLADAYPALRAPELGPDAAGALVRGGSVLPVLDGLDELPEVARAKVVTALNRSLGDDDQVILTSRTVEFVHTVESAGDVLTAAAVIEPEPLTGRDAATYLSACLPPGRGASWNRLLTVLRSPAPNVLAEVLATPLYLWLVREVYVSARRDPEPLLDRDRFTDATAIRSHLLDQIIPAVLHTRRPSGNPADLFQPRRAWGDAARVQRWLGFLAHHLQERGTRDFAWWHLARHTFRPAAFAAVIRSTFGLAIGLLCGFGLRLRLGVPTWPAAAFGAASALLYALAFPGRTRNWLNEEPGFVGRQRDGLASRYLPALAVGALALGALVAIDLAIFTAVPPHRFPKAHIGLYVVALAAVLLGRTERSSLTSTVTSPLSSWRADRSLTLLRLFMLGPAIGVAIGLALAHVFGDMNGLTSALAIGIAVWYALTLGKHHAWLAYVVATTRLVCTRRLPRRLLAFLDDAHRLGLLRAVGPVYQFRHADLQDHLAAAYARQHIRPDTPWRRQEAGQLSLPSDQSHPVA